MLNTITNADTTYLCAPFFYLFLLIPQEDEEDRRDYDMHRLAREEKLKGKKLRGKRKRKEIAREKAPGQDFRVDVADERFAAVLEGDTRFGIDRTDSSFKVRAHEGGGGRIFALVIIVLL